MKGRCSCPRLPDGRDASACGASWNIFQKKLRLLTSQQFGEPVRGDRDGAFRFAVHSASDYADQPAAGINDGASSGTRA
jgi:hypothetical protein